MNTEIPSVNEPSNENWGGPWTETKLNAFEKYVKAYLTIMSKHPYFKTIYFDGFAGSGKRDSTNSNLMKQLSISLEDENIYQGAAERVVKINEPISFDWYYFIEKNNTAKKSLEEKLLKIVPEKKESLIFRVDECDEQLSELANALAIKDKKLAALIFIDPFGMHISWESITKLRGSRSDVWILIPTGVIVNRLLDRKGKLQSIKLLENFFGMDEEEIRKEFYSRTNTLDLFGEKSEIIEKVMSPIKHIAQLYTRNLNSIWDYVTDIPLVLKNKHGSPIFHFVFASNNKNAVKIAQQIITKL